ncbi:MoxR-like ATPase in aerotolerance operon [hydrothermal vent metagenome]|uniref:MoxR-like ATPase in aerotolerance operon n=1 Tax=hydrothermal vent metagenome TaxID=652676 RepID=A0A3B0YWF0_9ZZZZ
MSAQHAITKLQTDLNASIIGQEALVTRLLIALLADGHLLVEGAPGLAKTTAIKNLAKGLEGDFHRIQFTPDLLPADVTGTEIYRPQEASFKFQKGPLFHHFVLADEINRAPAKVQSALLEAMGERQVTVGKSTYPLPPLFLVMATQNPIEQEGTYPLPEAQLDRFLMLVRIDYPDKVAEKKILELVRQQAIDAGDKQQTPPQETVSQQHIFESRQEVLKLHLAPALEDYIIELVTATRQPELYGDDLARWVAYGASPRATIALDRCARAHAWLHQRDYVSPQDIQEVAPDILRHRVILSFEAEAEGVTTDTFIAELLNRIPVP